MSAPILHVADAGDRDGSTCARCSAVLGGPDARFMPSTLVVTPDGYYKNARMATPDDLRTGVLCEVRPTGVTIRISGVNVRLERVGDRVNVTGQGGPLAGSWSVEEAMALVGALRYVLGPFDTAAEIDKGRRFVERMHADVSPRPTELGATER